MVNIFLTLFKLKVYVERVSTPWGGFSFDKFLMVDIEVILILVFIVIVEVMLNEVLMDHVLILLLPEGGFISLPLLKLSPCSEVIVIV